MNEEDENIFESVYFQFESVYFEHEVEGVVYGLIIHIPREKKCPTQ